MFKKSIITLAVIAFLVVVYWLASPLFINSVVDEALPEMRMETGSIMEALPSNSTGATIESVPAIMPEVMVPVTPLAGIFQDGDSFHKGSGDAKIITMEDNSRTLRLENFSVTNGPDLFVYVTNDSNARDGLESFTNIGALKGNKGNQNYTLPADLTITNGTKVLIWCRAFGVLFAEAELKA